jgi:hypothetical protein
MRRNSRILVQTFCRRAQSDNQKPSMRFTPRNRPSIRWRRRGHKEPARDLSRSRLGRLSRSFTIPRRAQWGESAQQPGNLARSGPPRRGEFASKRILLRSSRPMSESSSAQPAPARHADAACAGRCGCRAKHRDTYSARCLVPTRAASRLPWHAGPGRNGPNDWQMRLGYSAFVARVYPDAPSGSTDSDRWTR